jgi:hypothetical protein
MPVEIDRESAFSWPEPFRYEFFQANRQFPAEQNTFNTKVAVHVLPVPRVLLALCFP